MPRPEYVRIKKLLLYQDLPVNLNTKALWWLAAVVAAVALAVHALRARAALG